MSDPLGAGQGRLVTPRIRLTLILTLRRTLRFCRTSQPDTTLDATKSEDVLKTLVSR